LIIEHHRAAEQVDQAQLLRQAAGRLRRGVATELQLAFLAIHLLDQPAIDVVSVGAVTQFGEEEGERIRTGIAGDVEDADIDCR
jgi:hypothetical protein